MIRINRDFLSKLPVNVIALQTLFYTTVGVFGSYLVLYYESIGFTSTQIGILISVATVAVLLTQPALGWASDRAKDGRTVLSILFVICGFIVILYYLSTDFYYVLVIATVYTIFFNPVAPIIDSLTLETIEREKRGFDYGYARIGGTLGYSMMVLLAGWILKSSYIPMFYISSALFFISLIFVRRSSSVKLRATRGPLSPRALLRNKKVLCFMFINLINAFGMMGFYTFYPLHFIEHVGGSDMFGILLFTTAMSELPFWFVAGRITRRIGYERMLLISVTVVGIRWALLGYLTAFPLIILINLLHGFCFVTLNYSIVNFLNNEIPKELRATGQTMNNLSAMVISRVIGGAMFGVLSDIFGMGSMFLFLSLFTLAGALIFFIWIKALDRIAALR